MEPVESGEGYAIFLREAEEPSSTMRPRDTSLLEKVDKPLKKKQPVITENEKAETDNLRRKRLQLRRNRYLLLQEG